jgi:arylsulfatase A-like enzyme
MLGDHSCWGKSTWRDPSIRVPLVISGPGVQRGIVSESLISLHDLTATFIDAGAAAPLQGTDSMNLWPLLRGETDEHRQVAVSALGNWRCVVNKTHKYVAGFKDNPDILIDLLNDPLEDNNIAQANEEITGRMK